MVEKLFGNKVIGIKQSTKAIKKKKGKTLYIALDANKDLVFPLESLAYENGMDIKYIDTMKNLGIMCDIDVKASVALILN